MKAFSKFNCEITGDVQDGDDSDESNQVIPPPSNKKPSIKPGNNPQPKPQPQNNPPPADPAPETNPGHDNEPEDPIIQEGGGGGGQFPPLPKAPKFQAELLPTKPVSYALYVKPEMPRNGLLPEIRRPIFEPSQPQPDPNNSNND